MELQQVWPEEEPGMTPLLARYRQEQLAAHHRELVRIAAPSQTLEAVDQADHPRRFEFPQPQDLRGIPVIGHGVGGAIPGSLPHSIR